MALALRPQFHWHNERAYADFNDFLGRLQRDKRKKILQERRRVREAGVILEALVGPEIAKEDWDFFHRCY
ncbi:GNAT family N-acetyltransferase, partial [Escherichia coli]|nr:GNAT family N-acetyltransferase [Escherichia coli]